MFVRDPLPSPPFRGGFTAGLSGFLFFIFSGSGAVGVNCKNNVRSCCCYSRAIILECNEPLAVCIVSDESEKGLSFTGHAYIARSRVMRGKTAPPSISNLLE